MEANYNSVVVFAIHWYESAMSVHVSPILNTLPPPHLIPLGCLRALALSALLQALNLHWSSVWHMVIYIFQCYSLKSSHPYLLPESPKVCSVCVFAVLHIGFVITVFLNSIYMHDNLTFKNFNFILEYSWLTVLD